MTGLRSRFFHSLLALLFIISTLVVLERAAAQDQAEVKMTAQGGFDGYCKANQWIPVKVDIENPGPAIRGRVEARVDSSDGSVYTYGTAVDLPEASHKRYTFYLTTDTYLSELAIYLVQGDETLQSTTVRINCLPQTDLLFGVVASTPSAFNVLNELDPDNGSASVANIEIANLPERFQGLEALNVLFLSDVDTGVLTPEQVQALAGWLAGGGRLVVTGGVGWQKTAAGLMQFLPLEPGETQSLNDFETLADFSSQPMLDEAEQPLPISSGVLRPGALVLVEQDGLPLVVRSQYGLGDVFYLAFDPSMEPFRTWDGMPGFYRRMLAFHFDQPGWSAGFQNWQMADEAASSLPSIALPSAILVCGFLSVYVIVIGPVNYLALRALKRRELAWVTIPALVVFFSLATLLVGGISRGRTPLVSQANIIQVWPETGLARVDGLVSIYSPLRTTYQMEVETSILGRPIVTYNLSGNKDVTFLQNDGQLSLPGLRVDIGGVESFAINGQTQALPIEDQLKIVVDQSGVVLQGQITNQSEQTLEEAVLLYPGGVLSLGDFAPGSRQDINIPLVKAQISGRPQISSYAPYSGVYSPTYTYPYYGYGYYEDSTLQDILGTSSYYDDKEIYRRYSLLNSVLSSDYNPMGRGAGVYLCGWSEAAAVEIGLADRPARQNSLSLYLVSLTPEITRQGERWELMPGMFVWETMQDSASSRSGAYTGTIYPNETQHLRFRLGFPTTYSNIQRLILHLEGASSGIAANDLSISLWDFAGNQWVEIEDIGWGDSQIPEPERFIGANGTIQLSIANSSVTTYDFIRSDFSLVVGK